MLWACPLGEKIMWKEDMADERMLSTADVAKILNVSRPYVVKLADAGLLGVIERTAGARRRISSDAVDTYQKKRQTESCKALRELAEDSQAACLYGQRGQTHK
jgi:excisionase family DNA binding protein